MSESHVCRDTRVTEEQFQLIEEATHGYLTKKRAFFIHVLLSTAAQYHEYQGWCPVSAGFQSDHFKWVNVERMVEEGIMEKKPSDKLQGKSREFKITGDTLERFMTLDELADLTVDAADEMASRKRKDAFTGRRVNGPIKSILKDENRNYYPDLIVEAIEAFDICYINLESAMGYLRELKANYERYHVDSQEYASNRSRYMVDRGCLKTVIKQGLTKTAQPGVHTFTPAYEVASTGRIFHIGKGLQGASRGMKWAVYKDIEDCNNYDLVTAQGHFLLEEFEDAGIECEWLKTYLSDTNSKNIHAKRVGIDVDLWKQVFYALVMGAHLPSNLNNEKYSQGEISKMLREAYPDPVKAKEVLGNIRREVKELLPAIRSWHHYLIKEYVPKRSYQVKGNRYIKNTVGMTRRVDTKEDFNHGELCELAAFILQGKEACFIHNLTLLGSKYGFKPIGNEHDGLVAIGTIPQSAVDEAMEMAGLRRCILELKPFKQYAFTL